jgi:uncharacterized membrane protein YqjE
MSRESIFWFDGTSLTPHRRLGWLANILQMLRKSRRQFHRFGLRRIAMPVTMSDTEKKEPLEHDPHSPQDLSTAALVKEIGAEVSHLAHKQLELAMTELKADLKREAAAAAGLSVATIFGLVTLNLLFVTAASALAFWMPAWAAGLIVAGFTLIIALAIGLTAWNKRVVEPLARTRRTIREDVRWSKEKLA